MMVACAGMVEVLVCCLSLYTDYLGAEDKPSTTQVCFISFGVFFIMKLGDSTLRSALIYGGG
jgi:hypothetical protein